MSERRPRLPSSHPRAPSFVRGLSGCTPAQIEAVDPQFIRAAKISQTLTPGRNNGFLNMLAVMKRKAAEAAAEGGGSDAAAEAVAGALTHTGTTRS
jgi:hypothetical protein